MKNIEKDIRHIGVIEKRSTTILNGMKQITITCTASSKESVVVACDNENHSWSCIKDFTQCTVDKHDLTEIDWLSDDQKDRLDEIITQVIDISLLMSGDEHYEAFMANRDKEGAGNELQDIYDEEMALCDMEGGEK